MTESSIRPTQPSSGGGTLLSTKWAALLRLTSVDSENHVRTRIALPPPPGCLWLPQAAARLGVRPRTLYTWRYLDKGPAGFRHTGRVVYEEAAIDAYMAECKAADRHSNPALNPVNRAPEPGIRIPDRPSRHGRRRAPRPATSTSTASPPP